MRKTRDFSVIEITKTYKKDGEYRTWHGNCLYKIVYFIKLLPVWQQKL